jgi:hypothetical protein
MSKRRTSCSLLIVVLGLVLSGCARNQTVCPQTREEPEPPLLLAHLIALPAPTSAPAQPVEVVIGGKTREVDKVVDYPLCNDNWSGIVYVSCEAQVAEAELDADANPLFLKGCDLKIASNTVVYVAAHNDAPYYKGCSCHTGTAAQP